MFLGTIVLGGGGDGGGGGGVRQEIYTIWNLRYTMVSIYGNVT